MSSLSLKYFSIGKGHPLALIAGPCVIEDRSLCFEVAGFMQEYCQKNGISYVFKASYDKANRSSIHSYRGPGLREGLQILSDIKEKFDVPVVTDVHHPEEAIEAGKVCDMIQIPAFLCRQTDLLLAAAKSGKAVVIKKGQFMAPWDMANVVEKVREGGNEQIMLVDRGVSFGYNNLVSDMRAIPIMQEFGVPVCFDATHSVQLPGGLGEKSGGQRQFVSPLARAAVAVGANCLFIETHPDPARAKSDAASQVELKEMPALLDSILPIYSAVNASRS